jgi:3-oxoacyl-[acyl-carrier protein] reductase
LDLDLAGKVALVSGASGGIGQAICRRLLDEGAVVAPLVRGDPEKASDLQHHALVIGRGRRAVLPLVADLADMSSVEGAFEALQRELGRVDILVNNAGATLETPFLAMAEGQDRKLAEINLWGPMHLIRLALKPMIRARRGAIVNVTSVVASRGGRGVSVYAMTKGALETLTRILAIEVAGRGIRLNAVAPGVIETPMTAPLRRRRGLNLLDKIPMQRIGQPEDVANAVTWLASDIVSGYVTGQVITVDGGYSL